MQPVFSKQLASITAHEPGKLGPAIRDRSGTSRMPSAGTPGPLWNAGLLNIELTPPPVAPPEGIPSLGSFHTRSVTGPAMSPCASKSGSNDVPPIAVTLGSADISLTARVVPAVHC